MAFDELGRRGRVLREQLRQIQKELADTDTSSAELDDRKKAVKEAGIPDEVRREQAEREIKRLEKMPDGACWSIP